MPGLPHDDVLYRFLLPQAGVRGTLVRLNACWREVAGRADYPPTLRVLLGEALAASALLTGNIKLDGALSIELKSSSTLRLLFAECSDKGRLRGLARWHDPLPEPLALDALADAVMAITIGNVERGQRYQGLVAIGAVSRAEVAHAEAQLAKALAGVQQAEANLQVAREAREKTSGSRSSLDANIKNAEAGAKQAQINLENTIIRAPESGQLSQINVQAGQLVSAGTQLMYIVPKGVWIIANFKETQVANMTVGEAATIHVDALGGTQFSGHVSNISPATGSEFSAGAANPATGNYIKIAQRIPVRIDLDPNQPELARLRPGMSVSVDVDTK